jgi:predicted Rossmann fold flavoprotein
VNWLGTASAEEARDRLRVLKQQNPRKAVSTAGPPELPKRLWQKLVEAVGVAADFRWADLPKGPIEALVRELVQGEFKITGKAVFKEEFVTCGGIDLKSVDFKTLESRSCPGLHFAGEILDIDGITGGFNFQSAWSTGWIAGQAIAQGAVAVD